MLRAPAAQGARFRAIGILSPMAISKKIRAVLPAGLRSLFRTLDSPDKIQTYLDALPVNFELSGETNLSPLSVFQDKTAHCFEGAIFAAAALAYHGARPLIMDFATTYDDEDHTVALFTSNNRWGAISKTNHAVLKYRDAVYATPRELAMSYFHEYYLWDGRKSLRAYSAPFDLSRYAPEKWIMGESLDWLMARVAKSRYFPVAPEKNTRRLRRASRVELEALKVIDFPDPRRTKRG